MNDEKIVAELVLLDNRKFVFQPLNYLLAYGPVSLCQADVCKSGQLDVGVFAVEELDLGEDVVAV